jgi:predicted ArsR family transcriptional regulator
MKTNVSTSSLEAYFGEIRGSKESTQMTAILEYLSGRGWVSRKTIARDMKLEPGTVAGRVNELVARGLVSVDQGLQCCPVTGRNVHFVRAVEQQLDMFGRVA